MRVFHARAAATTTARTTATPAALSRLGQSLQALRDRGLAGAAVVDFFHAAEQLQDAFEAAYGEHTRPLIRPRATNIACCCTTTRTGSRR